MRRSIAIGSALLVAWLSTNCLQSVVVAEELRVAAIFGDNMVVQRGVPIKIWGWADPQEEVIVAIGESSSKATSDENGKWMAELPPVGLGDPFEIKVKGATKTLRFENVLAGEVWICSGQSNMEWTVRNSANPAEEIAEANYPLIRHVKVARETSPLTKNDAPNSGWQICSPETAGDFTAVGYYFGRELHRELNVPIGLVNTSWGGTIIEAWISGESLKQHPDFADAVVKIESSATDVAAQQRLAAAAKKWNDDFAAALADEADQWQAADLDDSDWSSIKVPGQWEGQGYRNIDGVAWYRRTFEAPAEFADKELLLSLAQVDDADVTYVNGQEVGKQSTWNQPRRYQVPAGRIKPGTNTIAVRVTDTGMGGGILGSPDEIKVGLPGGKMMSLAGQWKFKLASKTAELGPRPAPALAGPNHPTVLHNAMVHPIVPLAAKGVIWYQGESNTGRAFQYRSLMPLLVNDWRGKWQSELSFYWVQLANFMDANDQPTESNWAELREAQSMALQLPKTGQAVIIDIGEAKDIHPKNKQDVGKRLALNALAKDYGKSVEFSGPVYEGSVVEGNQMRIRFSHAEGLMAKGGELKRFQIAGEDQQFVWAETTIDGSEVVVSSAQVSAPVAVRYAWSHNPAGCNLYNAAGLPASPFRTDTWKLTTEK